MLFIAIDLVTFNSQADSRYRRACHLVGKGAARNIILEGVSLERIRPIESWAQCATQQHACN